MRVCFTLGCVLVPFAAHSVVATTSQTAPGAVDSTWRYVGSMNGASAVAIGANLVLTAGHVGAGDFFLGDVRYRMASTALAPKIGKNATDLRIVRLADVLPGWYDIGASLKTGVAVTMVGYGGTGVVNANVTGYALRTSGARRAGANIVSSKETTNGRGPTMRALLDKAGEAALAGGDSGGGWFSGGKLVGVSSFTYTKNSSKPAYGFAKKAYFGSGAIDLTNRTIGNWITAQRSASLVSFQPVPEPGTLCVFLVGGIGVMRRRRRD